MSASPAQRTPYEVLGVAATVTEADLRVAYRRAARASHPDTGGSAEAFRAVQAAWEIVGTPVSRAVYDRGGASARAEESTATWAGSATRPPRPDTRPRARSYGHPGGRARERYLALLREWAGRGVAIADPYAPALVRSAPPEIRRELAKALAEEATATSVSHLGMGFTIWNGVDAGDRGILDHIVLGPAGLYGLISADWGSPVTLRRGELSGAGIAPGREPVRELSRAARAVSRSTRTKFTALLLVVPDDAIDEPVLNIGRVKAGSTLVVRRSLLPQVLRSGVPGLDRGSVSDVFELRGVLQGSLRLV